MKFVLNRSIVETTLPEGAATIDYLRREAGLTGTKVGCREGDCGACTVLLGELREGGRMAYKAVNSCLLPLAKVSGRHLVTVEGLNGGALTPVQAAIVQAGATQCGFCTPGVVVSATGALLQRGCDRRSLRAAIAGNICRCTGYASILRACDCIPVEQVPATAPGQHLQALIQQGIVPAYFAEVPALLAALAPRCKNTPESSSGTLLVGGGTDLMVQCPDALQQHAIAWVEPEEGNEIREVGGELIIDSAVTFEQLSEAEAFRRIVPGLEAHMRRVASPQIRKVATVGGNLANASPCGDLAILFLSLGAKLVIENGKDSRWVSLEHFFKGYKTLDLKAGELIRSIVISNVPPAAFNFERVAKRAHLDIAGVSSACAAWCDGAKIQKVRISAGGVAPIPLLLYNTSAALRGKPISWETALEAAALAGKEVSPISDVRGTAEYRLRLLERLVLAHFHTLFGVEGELP